MGKEKYYQYFVEGEDEKKLVDVLKSDMKLIVSGSYESKTRNNCCINI